jgi:hypothetical protein
VVDRDLFHWQFGDDDDDDGVLFDQLFCQGGRS